jgi:hypothetical protein
MMRGVLGYEVTTEYQEILPSIPVVAHVNAVQTIDPKARLPYTHIIEEQHMFAFRFTGRNPGDAPATADSSRAAGRVTKPDRY